MAYAHAINALVNTKTPSLADPSRQWVNAVTTANKNNEGRVVIAASGRQNDLRCSNS